MNWVAEEYERERHADEVREAERAARVQALVGQAKGKDDGKDWGKGKDKKIRRALGNKLIEWGEQLQDGGAPNPSTAKI